MKKNTFVIIFPTCENVHLIKDVGQIPFCMHKFFDFDSSIISYRNAENYPFLDNEAPGLSIKFIQNRGKFFFLKKSVVRYLIDNSKKITVLNLYHPTQESVYYGVLFKILNPNGILYLKTDLDFFKCRREEGIKFSKNRLKEMIHQILFKVFLRLVDIISTETERGALLLQDLLAQWKEKIIKIPNGCSEKIDINPAGLISKKKNIILTVGRIGTIDKNNELLLNALKQVDLKDWIVKFIGPVEQDFEKKIEDFYQKFPQKRNSVFFTGPIEDRKLLFEEYEKSKILCLTSQRETFGIVLVEAISSGNYLIGTNSIASINDLTNYGEIGQIIQNDNVTGLVNAIEKCITEGFYNESLLKKILDHSTKFSSWERNLKCLNEKIQTIISARKNGT